MFRHRDKSPPPCRLAFAQLVRQPETAIDLAEATLLIAKEEYPDLDVAAYLSRLDDMGADVRALAGCSHDPHRLIAELSAYLFQRLGFRGNADNYYDPKNSFLNEVLDRRIGIPITLSAVYLEVGRRMGLRVHGVGMPGHFLIRFQSSTGEVFIDAFNRGKLLSKADCVKYLLHTSHGFQEGYLAPVSPRRVLLRVCSNLHQIYAQLELSDETARLQRYIVALGK